MDDGLRHVASFRIDGAEKLAAGWRIEKQVLYHDGRATRSAHTVHLPLYPPFYNQARPHFIFLRSRFYD